MTGRGIMNIMCSMDQRKEDKSKMIYIQGWLEVVVAFGILIIYLMNYFLFGFAFATICKKEKKTIYIYAQKILN